MAKLIVKPNSGAMRGLEVLGWERKVECLEEALRLIRDALNTELSPSAKALFHGGRSGLLTWSIRFVRFHGKGASVLRWAETLINIAIHECF